MEKDMKEKVLKVLESIRPGLQADGGDIQFVKIDENNVVYIHLIGACGGCPMSQITLKQGIERIMKMQIPEIEAVEAI
ncbi:MAG TPA: NifU family protein [Caldithrix abyssi]|uniref:NifU family protein n=1 Tax=Caldithrix abyssi TaxID=187145 RepID=A0A7V5LIU3_CALAY|nr:NifU family protein [Caldisericaceae bacterium]HHE55077.1 NifU family protein [Caldithrix abyssi]